MEKRLNGGSPPYLPYHQRVTDDKEAPGRPNPHTHVVLPGTYYDDGLGERVPLYFSRNRGVDHIGMLHSLTETQMVQQMERYVGLDWEWRYERFVEERSIRSTEYPDALDQVKLERSSSASFDLDL